MRRDTVAIASMTGFARAEGHADGLSWVWELKSVNGKALDLRFRLPPGFEALELPVRAMAAERLKRGNITISLAVTRSDAGGGLRVNRAALAQVSQLASELVELHGAAPPRADGLLALRGILELGETDDDEPTRERRLAALTRDAQRAVEALATVRRDEGRRLQPVLEARFAELNGLTEEAEGTAALQPAAIKARLKTQVAALLDAAPALSEERLAQEVALLAAKADLREELDRLKAHLAASRELLMNGGSVGRQFDFLCQELNREANTLCSKSSDLALTRIGLGLKAAIEQLREQIQNIE